MASFDWSQALLDLRAQRALDTAQGKPAQRLRPAPRRYSYAAPFAVACEADDEHRIGPRDVLDASAFERRR